MFIKIKKSPLYKINSTNWPYFSCPKANAEINGKNDNIILKTVVVVYPVK